MDINQILSTVSSWAVSITAIITCLSLIFKPIRNFVVKAFGFQKNSNEIKKEIGEIKTDLNLVKGDVISIRDRGNEYDAGIKEVQKDIKAMKDELNEKIERVSYENDDNERSRIRRDIMRYGMIARRHEQISEREFESLRLDYEKYHGPLHGNGIVTEEYNFIVDYYNKHYSEWM